MKVLVLALLNLTGCYGLIIPDEVPSILSVIYSNIPTLKKGTDSRMGWGFRLGDRADFQVLVELGPQTYTQPLANQGEGGASKRNTLDTLANTLYAKRQQEKQAAQLQEEKPESDGAQWIQKWRKTVAKHVKEEGTLEPKPGIAIGEIDAKSVIPEDPEPELKKHDTLKSKRRSSQKAEKPTKSLIAILTNGEKEGPKDPSLGENGDLSTLNKAAAQR